MEIYPARVLSLVVLSVPVSDPSFVTFPASISTIHRTTELPSFAPTLLFGWFPPSKAVLSH